MATEVEVKGAKKSVAEPTDISSLHTKDVGVIKGKLEDFALNYAQPPMSRFYGVLDLDKVIDKPDTSLVEYTLLKNQSYERQFILDKDDVDKIKMNTFDAEVLRAALIICKSIVATHLDKASEYYSSIYSDFNNKWEGNIPNV